MALPKACAFGIAHIADPYRHQPNAGASLFCVPSPDAPTGEVVSQRYAPRRRGAQNALRCCLDQSDLTRIARR